MRLRGVEVLPAAPAEGGDHCCPLLFGAFPLKLGKRLSFPGFGDLPPPLLYPHLGLLQFGDSIGCLGPSTFEFSPVVLIRSILRAEALPQELDLTLEPRHLALKPLVVLEQFVNPASPRLLTIRPAPGQGDAAQETSGPAARRRTQ